MKKQTTLPPMRVTNPVRLWLYISCGLVGLISIWRGSEWLIFIALIPFLYYITKIDTLPRKRVLKDFYFASFLMCSLAYIFIWQMAASNWIVNIPSWLTIGARFVALFYIASFCSLSFLLFGLILLKLPKHNRFVVLPFLWPLIELVRSYIMALISFGPHASLVPSFNFGALAVSAAGTPLVYASRSVGFFGLSALVVIINLCLFKLSQKRWVWASGLVAICLLTYLGWQSGNHAHGRSLNVAWVHLNEKETLENWNGWHQLPDNLDLLVLPEYSVADKNKDFKQIAAKLKSDGLGITSISEGKSPQATNTLVYFNNKGEFVSRQPKTFLIPTGEFLPYSVQFPFWLIGQQQLSKNFRVSQQIDKGATPEHVVKSDSFSVGTLVCSGVISPFKYHRLASQGADVLVNTASLSFLNSKALYHVHARNMARFHAVSNNTPFVQASRSGESYYFDNQGLLHDLYHSTDTTILQASISI